MTKNSANRTVDMHY